VIIFQKYFPQNLSLYSLYYAEACNEFAVPNSLSKCQGSVDTGQVY